MRKLDVLALLVGAAAVACGSDNNNLMAPGAGSATGGAAAGGGSNLGGAPATGGGAAGGTAPAMGGSASGGVPSRGGSTSSGGTVSQGGSTVTVPTGGTTATPTGGSNPGGGASSGGTTTVQGGTASGGSASGGSTRGGSVATGGSSSGGAAPAGGTSATGGTATTGGRSTGGGSPTGGTASSGGNNSTGGTAPTGGTASSGGSNSTGGTAPTGGTTATGGSSGGCAESTCGSHKWPCWKMPNPASSPSSVPNHQSYADLGNGAVRDNITCLVWEKANPSTQGNWQAAYDRCAALASSNYAGFGDWRMPTRVEMASISDVTLGSKGYPTVFTVTSGYYVTGSFWYKTILTASGSTPEDRVWGYGTNGFTSNAIVRSNTNNLTRCVRGNGSGEAASAYAVEPPNHYTVTGSGTSATVTDNYTGLIWQQTYSSSRMAYSAAASYCSSQTTGGLSGWRVPTLNELASTVNEALVAPAINRTVFPNTNGACDETGWFWAAEVSKVGGTAWGLSYCDGYTGWNAGTSASAWNYFTDAYVRCVTS